jgi:hypothetical protein
VLGLSVASTTWPQVVAFATIAIGAVFAIAKLVPFLDWVANRCPPKMEVHEVPPAPRNGNEGALVVYVRNHHTTALRAEAGVLLPSGDYTPLSPYRVEKVIYADVPARGGQGFQGLRTAFAARVGSLAGRGCIEIRPVLRTDLFGDRVGRSWRIDTQTGQLTRPHGFRSRPVVRQLWMLWPWSAEALPKSRHW